MTVSAHHDLYTCLRHPAATMKALYSMPLSVSLVPVTPWVTMTGISIGGSLVFGWSVGQVLHAQLKANVALWFALSAGVSWCIFGPILILVTKRSPLLLAHACLVSMCYGEGILIIGALLNILIYTTDLASMLPSRAVFGLDGVVVALSNVIMAISLAVQLKNADVSVWQTLLLWNVALNGLGIVLFTTLGRLLLPMW